MSKQMQLFEDLVEKNTNQEKRIVNHIVFVLDNSGSMSFVKGMAIENFNEQLKKIREVKDQTNLITIITFSSDVSITEKETPIDVIFDVQDWICRGTTALFDAIGEAIDMFEDKEYPENENHAFLVNVITDGYENASKKYGGDQGKLYLKEKIQQLESKNWTFVFMGGNVDTYEAQSLNFNVGNAMSFKTTEQGYKAATISTNSGYDRYFNARSNGDTVISDFYEKDFSEAYKKKGKK